MKAEWTNNDSLTTSQTTKAILVIDMPNNCGECKLIHLQGFGESICNPVEWEERPTWCPLKPMPQPKKITREWLEGEYENGWNDCLEALEDLQNGEDSNE